MTPPPPSSPSSRVVWLVVLAAVLGLSYAGFKAWNDRGQMEIPAPWTADLDAAFQQANVENKPVLAYFTASWCPPCIDFKKRVLADPRVIATLPTVVAPLMIDTDHPGNAQPLIDRLRPNGIPAFYVLDPTTGDIITRYGHDPGNVRAADTFLEFLSVLPRIAEAQSAATTQPR